MGQAHTPGPWAAHPADDYGDIGIHRDGEELVICAVIRNGFMMPPEVAANARLIAAAPDLLKACEAAEEWLSGWASAEPYLTTIRAALSSARATGGTE